MSAFSYHLGHPFILDSFHGPLFPQQVFGEMPSASSCFLYNHNPDPTPSSSATEVRTHERESPETDQSNLVYSPSVVIFDPYTSHGEISEPQGSMENKRKNSYGICISSSQSKGTKENRSRNQKKPNDGEQKQTEKKTKADEKKKKACDQEPPQGYMIHVRARRGQATDSHSLAERVRREKISEKMKLLQALVPGCDKVTGKALMLDEIINYVQSLQNQVEFLSMKLASVSPTLYDFGVDFDGQMNQLEKLGSLSQDTQLLSFVHQGSPIQSGACEDATRSTYHIMDTSATFLLHGQGPIAFPQDGGSLLMQVGEQRQGFLDQVSSRCSFQ